MEIHCDLPVICNIFWYGSALVIDRGERGNGLHLDVLAIANAGYQIRCTVLNDLVSASARILIRPTLEDMRQSGQW
jgi:hypothetical protein